MKEHIAVSDIVKKITENNNTYARKVVEEIKTLIEPVIDRAETCEKQDEAIIVGIYVRKGNDIRSHGFDMSIDGTTRNTFDIGTFFNGVEALKVKRRLSQPLDEQ